MLIEIISSQYANQFYITVYFTLNEISRHIRGWLTTIFAYQLNSHGYMYTNILGTNLLSTHSSSNKFLGVDVIHRRRIFCSRLFPSNFEHGP